MTFLFQIAAIVAACAAVGVLVERVGVRAAAPAAGVAIVALATSLAWQHGWSAAQEFDAGRRAVPPDDVQGGRNVGVNVDFLSWASQQMPREADYALLPAVTSDAAHYQWSSYQLLPRRITVPERADFLLFYEVDPAGADYDRRAFTRPKAFAEGFAIARRRSAR